ncbi:CvpA family protein [Geotalea toluenoxydans]|uniref:CvpA family protein n=1 Tax=Geotalea toluenoxydans TaxID=421624 RepID=UPI0006D030BA|nr:CvpA family protein [Geotalea toluenoxydans]
MILLDILIWAFLIGFVVKGFMKGLVGEACSLLGLVTGGWAAFRYYSYIAEAIRPFIHLPQRVALVLSFFLIFLVLGLLFYLLGHLLTAILKIMLLGGLNRAGGIVFGFLEGAFILCMVLYLATTKPAPELIKGYLLRSGTARPFISSGREIISGWDSAAAHGKGANRHN